MVQILDIYKAFILMQRSRSGNFQGQYQKTMQTKTIMQFKKGKNVSTGKYHNYRCSTCDEYTCIAKNYN